MPGNRHLFLSYSSTDAALARRLAVDLIDLGADVWIDQLGLGVGEHILDAIKTAVDRTDLMLVLVSRQSLASGWVQLEWQRLGVAGGNVLPVRLEHCSMPDALASQAYIDIAGGAYWNGVAQIAHRIGITDTRSAVISRPEVIALPTPIKVELGAEISPVFENYSDVSNPAQLATEDMRARVHARFGVPVPGIRFVGGIHDIRPRICLISIEDIPQALVEITETADILQTVIQQIEVHVISHLDRFIDPDLCGALYDGYDLSEGAGMRATTGEFTAILREAARQRLDLTNLSALADLLPTNRTQPLDALAIVEDLRPHQAERLSRAAATTGGIRALTLDPALETTAEAQLSGKTTKIDPVWADTVWQNIRAKAKETGANTLIIQTPALRRTFERLQMAELPTLARRDVHPGIPMRILGTVSPTADNA